MMDAMEKDRKKHRYGGGASKHATSAGLIGHGGMKRVK